MVRYSFFVLLKVPLSTNQLNQASVLLGLILHMLIVFINCLGSYFVIWL